MRWGDVNSRARGLGSRLLAPEALAALAGNPDLRALARELVARGVLPAEPAAPTAAALDLALRRAAGATVMTLRRWLGDREAAVAVALDAEDRRSLRALVRGAAGGVSAEARLSGLVPTPSLPERLLQELAGRTRIREQAALLVAAGHPYGAPLLAAAAPEEPDPFAIELAISRAFWLRAAGGARKSGGVLAEHVSGLIDLDNCRAALLLSRDGGRAPPAAVFIEGGRRVLRDVFERAALAPAPAAAARTLAAALGGSRAALVLRHAGNPAALDAALDEDTLARLRQASRVDPLGPAPLLLYFLRLRRQMEILGRLVWSIDLGAPPGSRGTGLETRAAG